MAGWSPPWWSESKLERLVRVMVSRGAACVRAAGWRLVAVLALVRAASARFLFFAEVWPHAHVVEFRRHATPAGGPAGSGGTEGGTLV